MNVFRRYFYSLGTRGILIFVLVLANFVISIIGIRYVQNRDVLFSELFNETQQSLNENKGPLILGESTGIVYADSRVASLQKFFSRHNSPLFAYAEKIVTVSNQYGFHYALLPAIAMQESGLCEKIPANSFNCWGWGIYGGKVTRFSSYDEAIDTVARGLKTNYIDKGYTTPEQIMTKYNPSNHNDWLGGVQFFVNILE